VSILSKRKEGILNDSNRPEWLEKVYNAQNNEELAEGYDAWAEEYDRDLASFGYTLPSIITGIIARYVATDSGTILDAGAGTGILGETMSILGYKDIVGLDISPGMLEVAHKKGVYNSLRKMTLGESLDFHDNTFSATVSMGTFTEGHAPPESFDELIRATKPGGHIIFSIRADVYLEQGFKEKQEALEKEGKWGLIEATDPFLGMPLESSEIFNRIFAYRVF
jgi:predicted TPR repeat methyltransferase